VLEPLVIAEADGLYHQRVPVPFSGRVAPPGRLRIGWERAAVGVDLSEKRVVLVEDREQAGDLDNLPI
jgi:hypothetical protein